MRPLIPAPSERPCVRRPARGPPSASSAPNAPPEVACWAQVEGRAGGPAPLPDPPWACHTPGRGSADSPPMGGVGGHHRGAAPGWTVCQRGGAGPCSPVRGNTVMPLRVGGCRLLARWSDPLPGDSPLPQPLCDSDFSREGHLLPLFWPTSPSAVGGQFHSSRHIPLARRRIPQSLPASTVFYGRVEHTPAPAADAKQRSSAAAAAVAAIIRERFEGDEAAVDGGGEAFPSAPRQKGRGRGGDPAAHRTKGGLREHPRHNLGRPASVVGR